MSKRYVKGCIKRYVKKYISYTLILTMMLGVFGCSKPLQDITEESEVSIAEIDFRNSNPQIYVNHENKGGTKISDDQFDHMIDVLPSSYIPFKEAREKVENITISNLELSKGVTKNDANRSDNADSHNFRFMNSGAKVSFDFKIPHEGFSYVQLELLHLESMKWPKKGLCYITVEVNGQEVLSRYRPKGNVSFKKELVDITGSRMSQNNTVSIRMDAGSETQYWLKDIAISAVYDENYNSHSSFVQYLEENKNQEAMNKEGDDEIISLNTKEYIDSYLDYQAPGDIDNIITLLENGFCDDSNAACYWFQSGSSAEISDTKRFQIMFQLVNRLSTLINIDSTLQNKSMQQEFLYKVLNLQINIGLQDWWKFYDVFVWDLQYDRIQNIYDALEGYEINGKSAFKVLADRKLNITSNPTGYQRLNVLKYTLADFDNSAINADRSWQKLFSDMRNIMKLYHDEGITLMDGLVNGSYLLNPQTVSSSSSNTLMLLNKYLGIKSNVPQLEGVLTLKGAAEVVLSGTPLLINSTADGRPLGTAEKILFDDLKSDFKNQYGAGWSNATGWLQHLLLSQLPTWENLYGSLTENDYIYLANLYVYAEALYIIENQ